MRLLIVDQCSGSKEFPDESPVFDAEEIDVSPREALLSRDGVAKKKARNLYSGRQQRYITEAVDVFRTTGHDVDRYFISAGFGLVDESVYLPPYEVTFNEMSAAEVIERSEALDISTDVRDLLAIDEPYDVVFFALGSKYYLALDIEATLEALPEKSIGVVFNQEEQIRESANVVSIPARTEQAKEHGTIAVALKGVYLKHFADHVTAGEAVTTPSDVVEYSTTERTSQSGLDQY